jgi:hypothetical protein
LSVSRAWLLGCYDNGNRYSQLRGVTIQEDCDEACCFVRHFDDMRLLQKTYIFIMLHCFRMAILAI